MFEINYDSNFDDDLNFEKYMGYLYANIYNQYGINNAGVIAEIAPGNRAKVGIGLSYLGFNGTLYIVEPNSDALENILNQYKLLLPNAKIIGVCTKFRECSKFIGNRLDVVISNHGIDDLIISDVLDESELQEVYGNTDYNLSKQKLISKWKYISNDIGKLENIKKQVIEDWKDFFKTTQAYFAILGQYKSGYYYLNNNYSLPDNSSAEVLDEIKKYLITDVQKLNKAFEACETFGDVRVKNNIQNTQNWAVGQIKK